MPPMPMNWYKNICEQGQLCAKWPLFHGAVQFSLRCAFFLVLAPPFNSLRIVLWWCKSTEDRIAANPTHSHIIMACLLYICLCEMIFMYRLWTLVCPMKYIALNGSETARADNFQNIDRFGTTQFEHFYFLLVWMWKFMDCEKYGVQI